MRPITILVALMLAVLVAGAGTGLARAVVKDAKAAPEPQTYPPPVTVYNSGGSLVLLRVRDEEKKTDCYVLQVLGPLGTQAALSCLRDVPPTPVNTMQLHGWVNFP